MRSCATPFGRRLDPEDSIVNYEERIGVLIALSILSPEPGERMTLQRVYRRTGYVDLAGHVQTGLRRGYFVAVDRNRI